VWAEWGKRWNMGAVLGPSGLCVREYDRPEAEPVLLELLGGRWPTTPTARTGSGRRHVYFEAPPNGVVKAARDGLELRLEAHQCVVPRAAASLPSTTRRSSSRSRERSIDTRQGRRSRCLPGTATPARHPRPGGGPPLARGRRVTTVTAAELARRVGTNTNVRVSTSLCAMFAGWWVERGLCEETTPGHFRLTDEGWRVAAGLLDPDHNEAAA
jgi:hypothetical protein